jgi:dTDP-4-dehydrorhamnose reductase
MTRFLITGASGLLGLHLALYTAEQGPTTGVVHHNDLIGVPFEVVRADLAQPGSAAGLLDQYKPDVVVHCAAMASLDACEMQPGKAQRLNAEVPGELAAASAQHRIKLVHISTESVFDGQRGGYKEDDIPNPLGVYSRTKLEAEKLVMQAAPDAVIARVNFYGWSLTGQRSLGEFFFNNLSSGKRCNGFTDVFFCPLLVSDLAELIYKMVEKDLKGVYHVLSSESLSKYDFGCRLARQFGLDESLITPISWRESGLHAQRSPNLRMNTDKLSRDLDEIMPTQAAGLQRFYTQYTEGLPQGIRLFHRVIA